MERERWRERERERGGGGGEERRGEVNSLSVLTFQL